MDIQIRDVNAFARSKDLIIDRVYADRAECGASEDRKELRNLLRACGKGKIAAIIIPNLERLSRDVRIGENLFWKFDRMGIRVLIADMPFYNAEDRHDVMIRQIRGAIAEENRKEIIERLWKGRQERVRQGRPSGGTPPYGFRRVLKLGFAVEPHESEVVKSMFELFDAGETRSAVADSLNQMGMKKRNGGLWTRWQVASIIRRRKLYEEGLLRYGDVSGSNAALIILRKKEAA